MHQGNAKILVLIDDYHTTKKRHGQYKNQTIQINQNNWERFHSCHNKVE